MRDEGQTDYERTRSLRKSIAYRIDYLRVKKPKRLVEKAKKSTGPSQVNAQLSQGNDAQSVADNHTDDQDAAQATSSPINNEASSPNNNEARSPTKPASQTTMDSSISSIGNMLAETMNETAGHFCC